jgi:hypothetical protein
MQHASKDGERNMKITTSSRWLGAECGEVKPDAPQPVPSR